MPDDRMQGASLYNGVLNVLKQMNPMGSAQAAGLPLPKQPQQPAPAAPAQPLPRASDALKPSAALPADPAGARGLSSVLGGAAEALGGDINDILTGIYKQLTPQAYLQQEERLLGGQMSPQEAAGFFTAHIAGGAPAGSVSAGIRLPGKADMAEASKSIQKIFSPTTVDPQARAAETLFREATGMARRDTSQAEAKVGTRGPGTNPAAQSVGEAIKEPWRPFVAKHIPEFQQYLAAIKGGATPLRKPELLKFLDFVETRISGATYTGPPELRELADILRDIYEDRAAQIAAEPSTAWAGFIQDYFPHMWQEKAQAGSYGAGAGGQGSGRSLKQRSIPTISDGIAAGLTPVSLDPIEMTMRYVGNIDRYLAHNAIFRVAKDGGMIKFFQPGKVPQGWMPLKGRLAERAVATGGSPGAIGMTAAAPEGFARVYNNAIGSGFFESEMGGPIYTALLRTKNGIVQTVLSLSGYHAYAMAQEAVASGFANAVQKLHGGDAAGAAKDIGLAAMPGVKPIKDVLTTGRRLERQYAGIEDYGADYEKMADLWARGGGQGITRGREWQASEAHNFITSFRRGMTMLELKAGLRHVGEGKNIVSQAGRAASFTATQIGRIMDTISAPIFDTMIPRLKKAAFFDEMSEWVRQHPTSSVGEQVAQARQVMDTMDDRFGEMMMDNIFWGKRAKQTLMIAATSLGWELGSLRSLGGAPFDAVRGKFDSPRVRYTIGLGTAIAIGNATYQYLMTGKTPGQDIGGLLSKGGALDLALPRTGGLTPEGAYEREISPGFLKDIFGYWKDPVGEFAGKLSPFGKLGVEAFTGRDSFTGRPIADFPKYTPDWFKAWGDHVLGAMRPIPLKQETYKGSAIPTWQRFMGARPAPEYLQNPERIDRIEYNVRMKNLQSEMRALVAHGARTTQEPKYIQQRTKEIQEEMQRLTQGFQAQVKKDQGNRNLYFPPKRETPGQVLQ